MSAPPGNRSIPDSDGEPLREDHAVDAGPTDTELAHLYERVSRLETELDQKDAELDAVRRRYEAVLDRRDASVAGTEVGDDSARTSRRTVDLDGLLSYLR